MHILLHCAHTYAWVTCSSTFSGQPLSSFCSCCCINYQHQEQLLKLWWFGGNVPSTKSKFQWIALQHKVRIVDGFDPQDQLDPARPTYQLEGQFGKKTWCLLMDADMCSVHRFKCQTPEKKSMPLVKERFWMLMIFKNITVLKRWPASQRF